MSEQKLRALLAEARKHVAQLAWWPNDPFLAQIDAALAQPAADEPAAIRFGSPMYACLDCGYCDEGLTLVWQDGESTRAMCVKCRQNRVENIEGAVPVLACERDEARAEVERLRGEAVAWKEHSEAAERFWRSAVSFAEQEVERAYRRGANAMREAAAQMCAQAGYGTLLDTNDCERWAARIRALPIPEDEP